MRPPALFACSVVMFCLVLPVVVRPPAAGASSARLDRAERKVIRLVNQIRRRHGLRRLVASRPLARAAVDHSEDMVRRNFFGHASSDGTPMPVRVKHFTHARWVGENLALVPRSRSGSARRVVRLWMHSAGHRSVLLDPKCRRIGVGKRIGRLGNISGAVYTVDFASKH